MTPPAAGLSSRRLGVKERALWMLQRLFPDLGISNEGLTFAVPGRLDHEVLDRHVRRLVRRHPALRTVFPEIDGEPFAVVLEPSAVEVATRLVDRPTAPLEEAVADFVSAPFELAEEPPFRVGLWRYPAGDVCCLALHHLVYDAWTAGALFADLVAGYNADVSGTTLPAELTGQVEAHVEEPPGERALGYWRAQVADVRADRQQMAMGRLRDRTSTFAGAARRHDLSPTACAAARSMARQYRASENIVLLAAYYLLLARHGAGPDLVVGVPVDARDAGQRAAVGYHVNSLPIRVLVEASGSFGDLVAATRDAFMSGLMHREVPYEAVLPDLAEAGANWRSPLFRFMFNYRPVPLPEDTSLGGNRVEIIEVPPRHSLQDLVFTAETGHGHGSVLAVYRTEVFDEADVAALQERYEALLVRLASAEGRALNEVDWWSPRDRAVVDAANDTADHGDAHLVVESVEAVGHTDPKGVAIVDGDGEHRYDELLGAAADIRDRLCAAGVARRQVVAVYAERGLSLAAAALGIWSAGATYLPLHPDNPAELVAFQLADSGAAAVLADRPLPTGTAVQCPVLPLHASTGRPEAELGAKVSEEDTAYVIYTSGSTGRPKGVEVTHGNLANVVDHFARTLSVTAEDAVLWLSTFAFDISALELFLPLTVGGRVVVAPDPARADAAQMMDLVVAHDVRIIQATPTTWAQLTPESAGGLSGRTVLCGGEPLPPALAATLLETGCQLTNVYGPSETTIWSTTARLAPGDVDPVPIGTPLRNTVAFVVDAAGAELPPGVVGELCIGGKGVARGYLNRPELTRDRFGVSHRYGRYYRTGDRASWRHDGTLLLHGRTDRQVKVRAHRIELGEVEAALIAHPGVAAAAVLLREDVPGEAGLAAFVQPVPGGVRGLLEDLWRHTRATLPSYALPAHIELGRLPLTPSGKVDYRSLAARPLARRTSTPGADGAANGMVGQILELWRELLDDPQIGPNDNFFLAGGQSLTAVRMLTRVSRSTGVRLSLDGLLDHPTATAFVRYVSAARQDGGSLSPPPATGKRPPARPSGPAAQVEAWREVFDSLYARAGTTDLGEDFSGWVSGLDGRPIPVAQMREWRDATVAAIAELAPRKVLEIGVGAGLLLSQLAANCESYWGTDLSPSVVEALSRQVAGRPRLSERVQLRAQPADDVRGLPERYFDTIVLNSVVQYFPNVEYLTGVLRTVERLLVPGGVIFVGDVRHPGLATAMRTALRVRRSDPDADAGAVRQAVRRALAREDELLVAPEFFTGLSRVVPGLDGVDVRLKRGRHRTEMACYRYDVVLRKPPRERVVVADTACLDWAGADRLAGHMGAEPVPLLRVRRIPNARTWAEVMAMRALDADDMGAAVSCLDEGAHAPAVDPESLHELGRRLGYRVVVTWSPEGPEWMEAVFVSFASAAPGAFLDGVYAGGTVSGEEIGRFANDPSHRPRGVGSKSDSLL
jgi:amino acid adenylation domain-containing protein